MLKFHPLALRSRTKVAADAYCLQFHVPEELRPAFRFLPGQHLALRVVVKGQSLRRTYSIVSPADGDLKIGVRVQGAVSRHLAEDLAIGEQIEVMTPNGSFHPHSEPGVGKRYVGVAAGSGITPVLSIVASVLAAEADSHFLLLYGNRDMAHTMFAEELLALKNLYPARFAVHFFMSREPQDVEIYNGRLDEAKVRQLAGTLFDVEGVEEFFLCGPSEMTRAVGDQLRAMGAKGRIHAELFGPAGNRPVPASTDVSGTADQTSAQITVVMDGRRRVFKMPMSGEPILDAAERAGIDLPFACRAGVCSTCRTRVTAGEVKMDYNQALENWEIEEGYVLCCQSRPVTQSVELNYDEK